MKFGAGYATTLPPSALHRLGSPQAADAAPAGDTGILGIPHDELTPKVRAALSALVDEVHRLRQELDEIQTRAVQLGRLADEDPLLPVVNRRAFVRELGRAMAFAGRHRRPGSIVYVDVNDLKRINDTFGHAAGDAVLTRVAQVLNANVRKSDAVGRLGGDEFGVILSHTDSAIARHNTAAVIAATRPGRGDRKREH